MVQNSSPLSRVSLLVVQDFLQLPQVKQKHVFIKPSKRSYRSFNGWLWEKFQLHKLVEIVWQSCQLPTANLPAKLKLCVGARVMLTDNNISVSDRLINGSSGTVKHFDRRSKRLRSTLYVKFDDLKVGNSMKDRSSLW